MLDEYWYVQIEYFQYPTGKWDGVKDIIYHGSFIDMILAINKWGNKIEENKKVFPFKWKFNVKEKISYDDYIKAKRIFKGV